VGIRTLPSPPGQINDLSSPKRNRWYSVFGLGGSIIEEGNAAHTSSEIEIGVGRFL